MTWTRLEVVLTVVGFFVWLVGLLILLFASDWDRNARRLARVLMAVGGASFAAGVTSFALP